MTEEVGVYLKGYDQVSPAAAAARSSLSMLGNAAGAVGMGGLGLLQRGAGGVSNAFYHLKGVITGFSQSIVARLGAGFGLLELGRFFSSSIRTAQDFGQTVIRLAKITGLGAETTSALAAAMDHFGISGDQAITITARMMQNIGNLSKQTDGLAKFEADYGLKLRTKNGALRDANSLILASADYFNNRHIPAATKAAALAKLFGRNWRELVPFLAAGSAAIKDVEAEAARLGMTLKTEDLLALQKNKEATRVWGDALGGLKLQIGVGLLPYLTELAIGATKWVQTFVAGGGLQRVKEGFSHVAEAVRTLITTGKDTFEAIKKGWESLPPGVRDLLVKGFVADRVMKFAFGIGVTDIAGGLMSGLTKGLGGALGGFLGRGSAVNPMYVRSVGGVGGPGGGASALGVLGLGALAVAAVAAVAIQVIDQINAQKAQVDTTRQGFVAGATLPQLRDSLTKLKNVPNQLSPEGPLGSVFNAIPGLGALNQLLAPRNLYDLNVQGVKTFAEQQQAAIEKAIYAAGGALPGRGSRDPGRLTVNVNVQLSARDAVAQIYRATVYSDSRNVGVTQ